MATKFYLHRGTTTNTGTLPSASALSSVTIANTATGAGTNRVMDTTIGASAQTSLVAATNATSTSQISWFGRWCSAPLADQTLTNDQPLDGHGNAAWQQSNTNTTMSSWQRCSVFIWRPDTGAVRSTPYDINQTATALAANINEQQLGATNASFLTGSTGPWTVVAGDFLVVEIYGAGTQAMNTSYNRTLWYDGTTEASTTNNAAYIEFTDTIVFQGAAAAQVPYTSPYPPLLAQ